MAVRGVKSANNANYFQGGTVGNVLQPSIGNVVGKFQQEALNPAGVGNINLSVLPTTQTTQPTAQTVTPAELTPEEIYAQALKDAQTQLASSGSGTASTATDYGIKTLPDGRIFNLNNPDERLAYSKALADILGTQRDQALAELDKSYKTNDAQSVQQYQQYISQIDQNLSDINKAAADYATSYGKTVSGFNESKGQGDVSRQNYFAGISPNAFQSSQATSQEYANNKYLQGLADLASQAQGAVGLDYINAFNPQSGTSTASFDPNSQYGRNVTSLGTQRTGLENSFNTYRQGAQNNLQAGQTSIGQNYYTNLNANNASLGQADIAQGTNPFQYGVQSVTPYQASQPDLSQYTPYTSFNSLSNPSAPNSSYVKPVATTNAYSQPSIDSWLGRTNTTLTPTQKTSWINNYLQGKVTA